MTEMLAKDFMTKDVVTVEIPSSRDDVLRILKRTGISGVPVVKGEEKKKLTIEQLLQMFEASSGSKMTSDKVMLSK